MKALINGSKILDVCEASFPVHPDLTWVDCGDDVNVHYTYVNDQFVEPAVVQVTTQSLTDMILADPAELAKLKQALGIA